jgi:hypothetical protein
LPSCLRRWCRRCSRTLSSSERSFNRCAVFISINRVPSCRTHRVWAVCGPAVWCAMAYRSVWAGVQEYEMGDVKEAGSPLVRPLVDRVFALVHTEPKHALALAHAIERGNVLTILATASGCHPLLEAVQGVLRLLPRVRQHWACAGMYHTMAS